MLPIGINWVDGLFDDAEDQIKYMKSAGFSGTFIGSENERLPALMKVLEPAGIRVETLHAPFVTADGVGMNDIWNPGDNGERMLRRLIDGLEKCSHYNVPKLIVHLSSGKTPPPVNDLGLERFGRLADKAAAVGVKICFENQRVLGNLAVAMEMFPETEFCWDTGHEECFAGGRRYMPLFGSRLGALHVQDNLGEQDKDRHMIPGDGIVNFDNAAKYIAAAGFCGTIMLELKTKEYKDLSPEEFLSRAAQGARLVAGKVEYYKKTLADTGSIIMSQAVKLL